MHTQLFVTDLDGTLLRSDSTLSAYTKGVINRLIGDGVQFTFATARTPQKSRALLAGLHLQLPAIALGGAVTFDPRTGAWLRAAVLPSDMAHELIGLAIRCDIPPLVIGRHQGVDTVVHATAVNAVQQDYLDRRRGDPWLTHEAQPRPVDQTVCICLLADFKSLRAAAPLFESRFGGAIEIKLMRDIYFHGGGSMEIYIAGVDKAVAINALCRDLGVNLSDVTVFGDNVNDKQMFEVAGTAVAVGNATPEIKSMACVVTETQDEDGVACYLARRFKLPGR